MSEVDFRRSDWPLIKHIARSFGTEVAQDWQRVPLVLIPEDGFLNYINEVFPIQKKIVEVNANELIMPFRDVVFEFTLNTRISMLHDSIKYSVKQKVNRSWIRIRNSSVASYEWLSVVRKESLQLSERSTAFVDSEIIMTEAFEERELNVIRSGLLAPDIAAIAGFNNTLKIIKAYPSPCADRQDGLFCNLKVCKYPETDNSEICKRSDYRMAWNAEMALAAILYLNQQPSYFVNVKNNDKKWTNMDPKNKKPWTRTDLPHVIMIDPLRVTDYQDAQPGAEPGTGSPKRAHGRRGHWRRLDKQDPDTRKVFVRPCWIGPENWEHHGQVYQLISGQQNG